MFHIITIKSYNISSLLWDDYMEAEEALVLSYNHNQHQKI